MGTDDVRAIAEHTEVLDEVALKRGTWASFPLPTTAGRFEMEVSFGITRAQTARVHRIAVFTTGVHPNVRGRQMRGAKSPVSVVNGVVATFTTTSISAPRTRPVVGSSMTGRRAPPGG